MLCDCRWAGAIYMEVNWHGYDTTRYDSVLLPTPRQRPLCRGALRLVLHGLMLVVSEKEDRFRYPGVLIGAAQLNRRIDPTLR
jgi:hypothetical protein